MRDRKGYRKVKKKGNNPKNRAGKARMALTRRREEGEAQ